MSNFVWGFYMTDLTSSDGLQPNASNIPCVIASKWLTLESAGWKPDWLGLNCLPSKKKLYNLLNITFSKVLPNVGKRKIGREF